MKQMMAHLLVVVFALNIFCESTSVWDLKSRSPILKTGTIAIFGGSGCLGRECVYQVRSLDFKIILEILTCSVAGTEG